MNMIMAMASIAVLVFVIAVAVALRARHNVNVPLKGKLVQIRRSECSGCHNHHVTEIEEDAAEEDAA